jgi:hypothetical protein
MQIMQNFIREALWGVPANEKLVISDSGEGGTVLRQSSLLDELLDGIFDSAASKYASEACQKLDQILNTSVVRDSRQRRYTQAVTGAGPLEPSVTTVPRGWLNSGKTVHRKRMHPSTRVDNHSNDTLASLRRLEGAISGGGFAVARGIPVPPTRQASLSFGSSEALRQALKSASKEDAWQQCHFGSQTTDVQATGWSNGETVGLKSSYQVLLQMPFN